MSLVSFFLLFLVISTVFERFNIFIAPLDFSLKLSLILLLVVGLVLILRKKLTFNPTFLFPFLVAVVAVEGLSIFSSYNRFQSFQVVVLHLMMIGLLYLIVWGCAKVRSGAQVNADSRGFASTIYGWLIGALLVSLLGFWQFWRYLAGQPPSIFLDRILGAKTLGAAVFVQSFFGRTFLRPSSTFTDTNTAASFVGIAIILGLGSFLVLRRRGERLFLAFSVLTLSPFFLMSLSRSAILGLAVGLAVFSAFSFWGRIKKVVIVAAVVAFLTTIGVAVGYFSLAQPERAESSITRLGYVRAVVEMVKHNPILGIGVGNFERYYTEIVSPAEPFGYSHSIFLTWLGETGVLGLMANLALIGAVVLILGRETLRHPAGSFWRLRLSSLLGAYVALVIANIFHAHYGLEFTWVLLGLCVSGYYLAKSERLLPAKLSGLQKKVDVLGVGVNNVTMAEAVARVKGFFREGKQAAIFTPNPEMVMLARRDPSFRKVLNGADLSVPDGIGLVWASRILGTPLAERVAGRKLFLELCAEAARRGGRIFLLGAMPGSAEKAARELKRRYPKLRIAGTFAGDGSPEGDKVTVEAINRLANRPIDLLFVAYGHGKQERWIARNLKRVPVKVAMGVGGTLDYVAGTAPKVPSLVENFGMEWLYRLVRQPWRLRRQLVLFPFAALVFRESLRNF